MSLILSILVYDAGEVWNSWNLSEHYFEIRIAALLLLPTKEEHGPLAMDDDTVQHHLSQSPASRIAVPKLPKRSRRGSATNL